MNDISEDEKMQLINETYWKAIRYLKGKLDGDSLKVFDEMMCIKIIQGSFPNPTERFLSMAMKSRNKIEKILKPEVTNEAV